MAGEVLVDGVNIRRELPSWQASIGYVPQTIVLLDDSVARNIALGVPDADLDRADLDRAVAAAQLGPTIAALPKGLETVVGERGISLSGGQRQRIGIARALYRNPDVLVMDEGTSALDSETERAVVEAVEALKGDRTILMVAHRLTTVMGCDRLFYIREGRVEAAGTYQELLAANAEFRRAALGDENASDSASGGHGIGGPIPNRAAVSD
jgi:ATP-binding cassette subfamily C protein